MKQFFSILLLLPVLIIAQNTNSLVLHISMNGNAQDVSGNGNHGTVNGATLTCDRCGRENSAYSFNGTSDYIEVLNSPSVDMSNSTDFTVCFWMKMAMNPNPGGIPLSKNQYGSWSGYQFFTNNTNPGYCTSPGQVSFYTASGGGQDACSDNPVAIPPGAQGCSIGWNFIVGVYDAVTAQSYLYVNGVQQMDIGGLGGNLSNSVNLTIGTHPAYLQYFKGDLDDIRIYKRKLSPSEITALYTLPCSSVNVDEMSSFAHNIKLFPNPADSHFYISLPVNAKDAEVKLQDIMGKEVIPSSIYTEKSRVNIDASNLDAGFYLISVITPQGSAVLKLEKSE